MNRKIPTHFLQVLVALVTAGTAAGWRQPQTLSTRATIGPDAVWNPPAITWTRLHQVCGTGDNRDCLPAFMKQNGASAAAVAVAERFRGESFVSSFKSFGNVGVATLSSPFQANGNETPILVNGTPDVVDVSEEANKLDPGGNDAYASIKKAFPNAMFAAGIPIFETVQNLAGGCRRFVFLDAIRDGCNGCDEVATARIGLDFDQFALYLGPKLLGITPIAQSSAAAKAGTSKTPETDQRSHAASVAPEHLITSDSVGPVRIGMAISQARVLLPQLHFERTTIADGALVYRAYTGTNTLMFLIPVPKSQSSRAIDESALIHSIEVLDADYVTQAGVYVGMPLRDVEVIYGKLLRISMSEIEMQEFAAFPKLPEGISIRVSANEKIAGVYPQDNRTTVRYNPDAKVQAVLVSGVQAHRRHQLRTQIGQQRQPGRL